MTHFKHYRLAQGFTLVELILAMLFISVLLLAIGGLVIQVGTVFTKGMTVRAVNEAGQLISSDIQRTFNASSSSSFALRPLPSGGGRVCVGNNVYAWNPKGGGGNSFVGGDSTARPIRLVKFQGGADEYCRSVPAPAQVPVDANDLLNNNESNLYIQQLLAFPNSVVNDPSQKIYTIYLRIGTSDSMINSTGCEVPASVTDDQYCSINAFTFTARAGSTL